MFNFKGVLFLAVFLCSCGGGGASTGATNNTGNTGNNVSNVLPVSVENASVLFPGINSPNIPYVSVTICQSGTKNCAVVDHVLVDTGSSGLRIFSNALPKSLLSSLPYEKDNVSNVITECAQFADGYTWGSVVSADVKMAGEVAGSVPIEIINDALYQIPPGNCQSTGGSSLNSPSAFGANGVLGIGIWSPDCGSYCTTTALNGFYYSCDPANPSSCNGITLPLAQQVGDPVFNFKNDNNGFIFNVPSVPSGGETNVNGSLTFGVGTQANNAQFGTFYGANFNYDYGSTYNGMTLNSIVDSGSSIYFFPDVTINSCSGGIYYCPANPLDINTFFNGYNGSSATISFVLENPMNALSAGYGAIPGIGASNASYSMLSGEFDYGMPFFFGRPVGFIFDNATSTSGYGIFF
jgi:hypothetical protein